MTPATIIAQMRRYVSVDTTQYSDADALIDLNTLKDEFWSYIVTFGKKLGWDSWTTSSVANQSEYTLAAVAYNTAGTKQLSGVAINYNGETYTNTGALKYLQCREVSTPNALPYEWNYYVENQSETDPIFYKADDSYFIAPAPKTVVTNGIKLTGIRKIADYTLSTTEANMKLPVDQHQALMYGLAVFGNVNKWNDANTVALAEQRRIQKRDEAINMIKKIVEESAFLNTFPDDAPVSAITENLIIR